MEKSLKELLEEIRQLEHSVAEQLKQRESDFLYSVLNRKVVFEKKALRQHRKLKKSIHRFLRESTWMSLLVSPVIYSMLIPAMLLDVFASLYQMICFPVYGIPKIKRKDYIALDRHKLKYLNLIERINCDYCGYFNGVIAYVRELASLTEQYFCPIHHALATSGQHKRQVNFLPFGDADHYHEKFAQLRKQVQETDESGKKASPEKTACGEPRK